MHYYGLANNLQLAVNLYLLKKPRERAQILQAAYRHRVTKFFNSKISPRSFAIGDWVLRKVLQGTKKAFDGVLGANWEGPYRVTKVLGGGAYALMDSNGRELGHP